VNLGYERVQAHLERLKLKRVAEPLDPISEQATKGVTELRRLLKWGAAPSKLPPNNRLAAGGCLALCK
jgi:hypothetical protein